VLRFKSSETDTSVSGEKMTQHNRLYLLDTPMVPMRVGMGCWLRVDRTKDVEYVKKMINILRKLGYEVVSAIEHQSTAKILSAILGFEIPVQRVSIEPDRHDVAIAFVLDYQLPEGKVLTEEELKKIIEEQRYSFYIINVDACFVVEIQLKVMG
jgi:hypothetical protein